VAFSTPELHPAEMCHENANKGTTDDMSLLYKQRPRQKRCNGDVRAPVPTLATGGVNAIVANTAAKSRCIAICPGERPLHILDVKEDPTQ
jgi:hypothetical protein